MRPTATMANVIPTTRPIAAAERGFELDAFDASIKVKTDAMAELVDDLTVDVAAG